MSLGHVVNLSLVVRVSSHHFFFSCRLSLDLFNHSALAEWAQGNTERMTKSIDEVFNNAKSIDDKLRAAEIKLDYQGMTGTLGFQPNALGFDGKSNFSVNRYPQRQISNDSNYFFTLNHSP